MNEKLAGRLLVADDDADILATIRLILKPEGHRIDAAQSPAGVLTCLSTSGPYDAILLDLNYAKGNTNGQEGIDLIGAIRRIDAEVPIMVMTAWGSVGLAVSALRRGARDFIEKPFEPARLKSALASAIELQRAVRRSHILESELAALTTPDKPVLIAESKSMAPVLNLIAKVGPSDANVLITGEPGTGKDVVARLVHSVSSRAAKPLVVVNAGGLADTLFESELFGHVKGAFTDARTDRVGRFELANGGTLFLDEIGNVPMALQTKLLRVLEVGEMERVGSSRTIKVDVRVISATNANLGQEVANNRFREDLLYRLNTVEIRLPPLRERREDIPVLAGHFLRTHAQRYQKSVSGFDEEAMAWLLANSWRGNVREINHIIERAVILASGEVIGMADLAPSDGRMAMPQLEDLTLEQVEEVLIRKALARANGNVTLAAHTLGVSRSALYRRLQSYGI